MSVADADIIQQIIEKQQSVTSAHEQWVQRQVQTFSALRETRIDELKSLMDWRDDRELIPDPLPEKISEAFADLLFGEDPVITAAQALAGEESAQPEQPLDEPTSEEAAMEGPDEEPPPDADQEQKEATYQDQDWLDDIVEANDLPSELRRSEMVCSSEGEVWWRIYVDRGQMPYPILEWHSRSHVRPFFRGRRLMGAAFVSDIFREDVAGSQTILYKYVQIQTEGYVRNLLYRGTDRQLGQTVSLDERPETSMLEIDWQHDLGMLAGRVPNKLGADRRYGISDLHGIKHLLFSLNEATTIGHENARLTAKKRAIVPASALKEDGQFDASEDVLVASEELDTELGKAASGKFAVLEYTFDAQALISYKTDLAGIILTRVGLAQQFVSPGSQAGNEGLAQSGTALRIRLIPTTLAAQGKARFWDDALPKILMLMALVDALDESRGGFGRKWNTPGEPPVVERGQPLPVDEQEEITRHSLAVQAEIESRRTAISALHPDWSEQQVNVELDQILTEFGEYSPKPPGAPAPPTTQPGGEPDASLENV